MFIKRLHLKNFRSYDHLALDFTQPRTLMIGPNGVGKSTVIDAISWALLGRCKGINAKGEGQHDLIRTGADQCEVTLTLDSGLEINRLLGHNGSSAVSMPNGQILGQLGTTEGQLQAVLYGSTFFDLQHADAKALLMAALNVRVAVADLPGVTVEPGITSLALHQIDALYDRAYEDRKVANRTVKNHLVPDRPKVIDMSLAKKSEADLRGSLRVEQDTLEKLIRDHGAADGKVASLQQWIADATTKSGKLKELQGKKQAHDGMLVTHQAALDVAQVKLHDVSQEPAEPVDSLKAEVREVRTLVVKLEGHAADRGCVLSAAIPCLTAASEFTGHVKVLSDRVADLEARIERGNLRAAAIAAAEQAIRDEQRNVSYHETQIAQAERDLADAQAAADQLAGLKKDLPGLKKTAQAAFEAVIDQRTVVDHLTDQVSTLATYLAGQKAHQEAKDKRADLEADAERLDALVKVLGPTGARMQALQAALSIFHADINVALEPFGFSIEVQVDPWRVFVKTPDSGDDAIRFEMLSKGEQLWTGLAFQLALAKVTGLNFAAVDDVEAVVGKSRGLLTQVVMASDLDQVLVAMAAPADYPTPNIPGLQVLPLAVPVAIA